jgi:hypothetical protein
MSDEIRRPRTLAEWRNPPQDQADAPWNPRFYWEQLGLGDLFLSRGYKIWPTTTNRSSRDDLKPGVDWPCRVFDGFAYRSPYNKDQFNGTFDMGLVSRSGLPGK